MTQTVFPCLTFRNARASFEWLESALGAEAVAVHEDDEGRVVHAELRIGESIIMGGDDHPGAQATPAGMSAIYVAVPDADAAYERAKAAGAQVTGLVDRDYGSREFTATDPDGNRWSLGTYRGAANAG